MRWNLAVRFSCMLFHSFLIPLLREPFDTFDTGLLLQAVDNDVRAQVAAMTAKPDKETALAARSASAG